MHGDWVIGSSCVVVVEEHCFRRQNLQIGSFSLLHIVNIDHTFPAEGTIFAFCTFTGKNLLFRLLFGLCCVPMNLCLIDGHVTMQKLLLIVLVHRCKKLDIHHVDSFLMPKISVIVVFGSPGRGSSKTDVRPWRNSANQTPSRMDLITTNALNNFWLFYFDTL